MCTLQKIENIKKSSLRDVTKAGRSTAELLQEFFGGSVMLIDRRDPEWRTQPFAARSECEYACGRLLLVDSPNAVCYDISVVSSSSSTVNKCILHTLR